MIWPYFYNRSLLAFLWAPFFVNFYQLFTVRCFKVPNYRIIIRLLSLNHSGGRYYLRAIFWIRFFISFLPRIKICMFGYVAVMPGFFFVEGRLKSSKPTGIFNYCFFFEWSCCSFERFRTKEITLYQYLNYW